MSDLLVVLLLALAALTALVYRLGRRRIGVLARQWAEALERAFAPGEKEYTNIGGLVGYHAVFAGLAQPLVKVCITFTFLPRHALFFYPVSRLFLRHDRMFLTLHADRPPRAEAHLLERRLERSPRHRVADPGRFPRVLLTRGGREYLLLAAGAKERKFLEKLFDAFPEGMLRHLALVPGNNSLYAFLDPGRGDVAAAAALLARSFGRYSGGRG